MSSTSTTFGSTAGTIDSDAARPGFCIPPPPPPPPVVPTLRINAVETAISSRQRPNNSGNNPYEPPAAIQNAMMTKDKKPFTYTPGMGGKLDLSQIRSPRMARRVAKNANDEGIEGPPKSTAAAATAEPRSSIPVNLYAQSQVAVLPTNPSSPLHSINPAPPMANSRLPFNETKPAAMTTGEPMTASRGISPPETPTTPVPQVTLAKAPTPWLRNNPREELPEWAKRSSVVAASISQPGSRPSPPSSPLDGQQQERVIPIRIEDRPSVFTVKNEKGPARDGSKQQQPQPSCHHRQRWGNASPSSSDEPSSIGGTYIVPVIIEDNNNGQQQQQHGVIVESGGTTDASRTSNQSEPGPVQSRSFRVLQRITDTDAEADQQSRKLRLNENDKILMNKLKERVDGDGTYLHREEDPRYRGAAIPSRAFRYLRNMTDSGDPSTGPALAAPGSSIDKRRYINSPSFEESQANLPASEQQAPEPKKYTGSAIPSRSFRILQAMTSPESIAKQENRRAVITGETESSMQPDNQRRTHVFPSSSSSSNSSLPLVHQRDPLPSTLPSKTLKFHPQTETSPNAQSALIPPFFWHYSDGDCRWVYYPVRYQHPSSSLSSSSSSSSSSSTSSSSTSSSSSSLSSSSSSSSLSSSTSSSSSSSTSSSTTRGINNNLPTLNPITRSPLYEMCEACYRHNYPHRRQRRRHLRHHRNNLDQRQQDGNSLILYSPFYNERLYVPPLTAVLSALSTIEPSSSFSLANSAAATTAATQLCTPSRSSSSSSSSASFLSSSFSTTFSIARSTIAHTPCIVFPTRATVPGNDRNCNPCLESEAGDAEGSSNVIPVSSNSAGIENARTSLPDESASRSDSTTKPWFRPNNLKQSCIDKVNAARIEKEYAGDNGEIENNGPPSREPRNEPSAWNNVVVGTKDRSARAKIPMNILHQEEQQRIGAATDSMSDRWDVERYGGGVDVGQPADDPNDTSVGSMNPDETVDPAIREIFRKKWRIISQDSSENEITFEDGEGAGGGASPNEIGSDGWEPTEDRFDVRVESKILIDTTDPTTVTPLSSNVTAIPDVSIDFWKDIKTSRRPKTVPLRCSTEIANPSTIIDEERDISFKDSFGPDETNEPEEATNGATSEREEIVAASTLEEFVPTDGTIFQLLTEANDAREMDARRAERDPLSVENSREETGGGEKSGVANRDASRLDAERLEPPTKTGPDQTDY